MDEKRIAKISEDALDEMHSAYLISIGELDNYSRQDATHTVSKLCAYIGELVDVVKLQRKAMSEANIAFFDTRDLLSRTEKVKP